MENLIRVGIQQRVLPYYRGDFFDLLSDHPGYSFSVFAGEGLPSENLGKNAILKKTGYFHANNWHLGEGFSYSCIQWNILQWLKKWDPQVLIIEANPRYLHLTYVVRWMHQRNRPVIGWGLGSPPGTSARNQKIKSRWLSQLDGLLTYSRQGRQEYAALGFPEDAIFVAANAVSFRPKEPYHPRPAPTADEKPIVLYVGRLQVRKKADALIEACAALPERLQPELVIIGQGPDNSYLQEQAAKIYPTARFLGALYGDELAAWFKKAHLFVLPGTGGLAIQQAMSHGLPIIAAQADGTQRDLIRSENGWLLADDKPETLLQTLQDALQDLPRLNRMGQQSYQIVQNEVNLEAMSEQFYQALDWILKKKI